MVTPIKGHRDVSVTWGDHDAAHPPIRVGRVTTTILDTAIAVLFSSPMPDADYEVVVQAKSNVSVTTFPSAPTTDGFTLNLSAGVNATFSYFAIGTV